MATEPSIPPVALSEAEQAAAQVAAAQVAGQALPQVLQEGATAANAAQTLAGVATASEVALPQAAAAEGAIQIGQAAVQVGEQVIAAENTEAMQEGREKAAEDADVAKIDADLKAAQANPTPENIAKLDADQSG